MTAKEYLEKVRKNSYLVKQMTQELEEIHSDIYTLQATGVSEKVSGSNTSDLADKYIKVEGYKQKVASELAVMVHLRSEAKELIKALPDNKYQAVLYARYINNLKWEDVTDAVNMGWSQTFETHNAAIKAFEALHHEFLSKK